jgi:hypothetical protein
LRLHFSHNLLLLALLGATTIGCTFLVDASDYIAQCEPGMIRCDDTAVMQCADNGKVFEVLEQCGEESTCLDGACTSVPEEDGEETQGESTGDPVVSPPTHWNPPVGDPKLGQIFGIVAHLSIQTAFPGAFVDVGICEGSNVVTIPEHPDACAHSLFVRITRTSYGLEGMFWHHGPEDEAPVALETEPIPMDPDDVFVLGLTDYTTEGVPEGAVRISMSLKSLSGANTTAFATAELPLTHVQTFGAWNWETHGDEDAVLSGTLSALEVEITDAPALSIEDLLNAGIQTGDFVTSSPTEPYAAFFSSQTEAGAIQLPIQEALMADLDDLP